MLSHTHGKILDCLLRLGRCSILASSKRDDKAAQELIAYGFCIQVKIEGYAIDEFYSLRLKMSQVGIDSVIVS